MKWYMLAAVLLLLVPSAGAETLINGSLNGSGIYLKPGDFWSFSQGYVISLKGISEDGERAWLQVRSGSALSDQIVNDGGSLVYVRRGNYTIFDIGIRIYTGPEEEVVALYPIYQYSDPLWPEPSQTPGSTATLKATSGTPSNGSQPGSFVTEILMALLFIAFIIIYMLRKP
ncbi:MAG TPA: hypothetical protein HA257_05005 [Candidatus Methanoperedenaceae archaeon]|nr:hypothetical protein [Candidatus Methanoperedenaceae archaeon]